MQKAICTTTINAPTKAIEKYIEIAERDGWKIFIAGDKKTPHDAYLELGRMHPVVHYLEPEKQERYYKKLSDLIGWNCIQRRNFAMIEAYKSGAEIIALVDDDNIPYENWGQKLAFGQNEPIARFHSPSPIFDPLSVTEYPELWHRGFPLEFLAAKNRSKFIGREIPGPVMVQADLWDGEPDVDAIARVARGPFDCKFNTEPFFATKPSPFNSQNTFLHRDCFPTYFLFPHVGRMDDIWAAYVLQSAFPTKSVVYGQASVYQERNDHNLARDLENELLGYKFNKQLTDDLFASERPGMVGILNMHLPEKSLNAYMEYMDIFERDTPNAQA